MRTPLRWQSKLVLLAVLPIAGADVVLQGHWYATQIPAVAIARLGLAALLDLVTRKLGAATPRARLSQPQLPAAENLTDGRNEDWILRFSRSRVRRTLSQFVG